MAGQAKPNPTFPSLVHLCLFDIEELGKRDPKMRHLQDVFGWRGDGLSFKIHSKQQFIQEVMPVFFPRIKYTSFTRMLHTFGFKKVVGKNGVEKGAYYHALFRKGEPGMARHIQRAGKGLQNRKIHATRPSQLALELCSATQLSQRLGGNNIPEVKSGSCPDNSAFAQFKSLPSASLIGVLQGSEGHVVECLSDHQPRDTALPDALSYIAKRSHPMHDRSVKGAKMQPAGENSCLQEILGGIPSGSEGHNATSGSQNNPFVGVVPQNMELATEPLEPLDPSWSDLDFLFQGDH